MGKAADNEKIKLEEAYWNNVAVGILVAGWFVPLTAFCIKTYEQGFSWGVAIPSLAVVLAGQYTSLLFKTGARKKLDGLRD